MDRQQESKRGPEVRGRNPRTIITTEDPSIQSVVVDEAFFHSGFLAQIEKLSPKPVTVVDVTTEDRSKGVYFLRYPLRRKSCSRKRLLNQETPTLFDFL